MRDDTNAMVTRHYVRVSTRLAALEVNRSREFDLMKAQALRDNAHNRMVPLASLLLNVRSSEDREI